MNALRLLPSLLVVFVAATFAAPGERVDRQAIKDSVTLQLGSAGTIQFKQVGDKLTELKLVKTPEGDQTGIDVEFKKHPEFLAMKLKNNLTKSIRYRAAIRIKGRQDYVETSLIVPVAPGLFSYESWGDPIEELVLFDFQLVDPKK